MNYWETFLKKKSNKEMGRDKVYLQDFSCFFPKISVNFQKNFDSFFYGFRSVANAICRGRVMEGFVVGGGGWLVSREGEVSCGW